MNKADVFWTCLWRMQDSDNPVWPMFTERVQKAMVKEMLTVTENILAEKDGEVRYWYVYNTLLGNVDMFEPKRQAKTMFALTKDVRSSLVVLFLDSLPEGTLVDK